MREYLSAIVIFVCICFLFVLFGCDKKIEERREGIRSDIGIVKYPKTIYKGQWSIVQISDDVFAIIPSTNSSRNSVPVVFNINEVTTINLDGWQP